VALQQTTRELWAQQGPFEQYTIHGIPQQNIPEIYIKGAVWNAQADPPRYVAQSSAPEESGTGTWFPIEFNEEHVCWVEVRLQEPAGSEPYWQAFRIAGEDLGLDITQGDVETHLQSNALNTYRESVASSHSSRASTPSVPSVIRPRPSPYQPGSRDQEIAHSLAESLNINEPMSNTLTMEVPAGTINPTTGHVDADDAALFRAIGPDHPDPPSVGSTDRTTHIPFGWIRPQGGGTLEPRHYIYRGPPAGPFAPPGGGPPGGGFPGGGPPGGGFPGRGPPGGGFPGGGPPGGGPPMPIPPAPVVGRMRSDKLVGNTPLIFTGDRSRAKEFITQWQLYEGVNITNELMRTAYQRAMLFLTYIQGPVVNEWVKGVNAWLRGQIVNQRWAPNDERLWNEVFDSFNRQFANVMEQEDAQAALAKGLQLDKGDLDKLITEFEQLVRHAGYDINQDLVLRIFTSALPNTMYEYILRTLPQPATYEQWRTAAIDQQRVYVHMRNRADRFRSKPKPMSTNTWKPFNSQWRNPQRDPNAMDTSPGRMRAWVAEAEDFLPGGNRYKQRVGGSREGGYPRGPVQKDGQRKVLTCFFCGKPGHFARDCRQKRYGNQGIPRNNQGPSGPPRNNQGPVRARQTQNESNIRVVDDRSVADDRTPQQRASDWLTGVADENDDVKDIVMQELWGKEDFQNA
jgi:hypothetical protein